MPLDLDSPRWAGLEHAYGDAGDVPQLLRDLEAGDEEALDELIGAIAHQGTVYTASIASVPHLLGIVEGKPPAPLRDEALLLAAEIAASRDRHWNSLPADLESDLRAALPRLRALLDEALSRAHESDLALHILKLAARMDGVEGLDRLLEDIGDGQSQVRCPACDRVLDVVVASEGLSATIDTKVIDIRKFRKIPPAELEALRGRALAWLEPRLEGRVLGQLAAAAKRFARPLDCPGCRARFELAARVIEEDAALVAAPRQGG